jgi:YcxB-like protein
MRGVVARSRAAPVAEGARRIFESEGRLTPAELNRAIWARLSRWPALWALLLVTVGVAVVALADGAPWYYGAALVGSVLGTLLWGVLAGPRRLLRSGATSRWTVSDTELRCESIAPDGERLVEGTMPWSALQRVAETRTAFLLFGASRRATPLPKRWFSSDATASHAPWCTRMANARARAATRGVRSIA